MGQHKHQLQKLTADRHESLHASTQVSICQERATIVSELSTGAVCIAKGLHIHLNTIQLASGFGGLAIIACHAAAILV